jgi:Prokaryotic E2 family E
VPNGRELLREVDAAFLDARGIDFEAQIENNMICLVLKRFRLPAGYARDVVDLLLRLPLQFPEAAPDMFWMDPTVHYANGRAPVATNPEIILGRSWQRWSRHFAGSPWRPGIDDLQSFYRLIMTTLRREVTAHAA